jgi:hypothetical protein
MPRSATREAIYMVLRAASQWLFDEESPRWHFGVRFAFAGATLGLIGSTNHGPGQ